MTSARLDDIMASTWGTKKTVVNQIINAFQKTQREKLPREPTVERKDFRKNSIDRHNLRKDGLRPKTGKIQP